MRRTAGVLVPVVALAGVLAGCGSSSTSSSPTTAAGGSGGSATSSTTASGSTGASSTTSVVVGSANFTENEILADIYADALRGHGVKVTTHLNIGSREIYYKELQSGAITMFPEYNGALLSYLEPSSTASSTSAVDTALKSALPSTLEALSPSPAQDNDSITVTSAYASAHHLSSIGDLKSVESSLTIGAPPEFRTREEGLVGLKKLYDVVPANFKPLDESGPLTIAALKDGTIQAGDIFTTDPSIAKDHFVSLADPQHLFPAQNVVPIVNNKVATPAVVKVLDAVSAAISTSDLVTLNNAVENDHVDVATVASQFVSQAKLG